MGRLGSMSRLGRLLTRPWLVGLVVLMGLLLIRAWDPLPVMLLRLQVFDLYQKIQPRVASGSQVMIVDIDEPSLVQYGQWPWPRTTIAQLLTELGNSGVKAIGFDMVFPEPDRMSPRQIADALVGLDTQTKNQLARMPDNDSVLANTFSQRPVVVAQSALPTEGMNHTDSAPRKPPVAEKGGNPRPYLLSYPGLLRTIPELEEAAAGHGVITLSPEPDGIVRRIPALLRVGADIFPALSLELLRVAMEKTTFSVYTDFAGIRGVGVADIHVPTDKVGRIWIHFSQRDPNRYVSAAAMLSGQVPTERLAGKVVLIGSSAIGLGDTKVTPIEGRLPGVEVHAQILDMIQSGSFLTRPSFAVVQELIILLLLGLFMIFLVPSFGAVASLFLSGCVTVGMMVASWYWYTAHGTLIDVSYSAVGIFGLYGLLSYLNYVREESSRRQIRQTFSRYVSPTLVDQLARHSGQLQLGGETKDMTVMFCDVRRFTNISEQFQTDPEGLTQLINSLFTPLTEAILAHNGTVDKYMGDSIMAFWNAPLDDADHASNACSAALAMLKSLESLNERRSEEATALNKPFIPINVGIGINTGRCVVGNLGSEQRFDYSVLGDAVNVASRLEGQSKNYDLGIIIGPRTADLIRDRFAILELDLIALKGKQEAARTYAVIGDRQLSEDPNFQKLAERHSDMVAAYRNQQWAEAHALLSDCRKYSHAPLRLYTVYEERIDYYRHHPPPADWEGVFIATSK